jgi:hypothetical protein
MMLAFVKAAGFRSRLLLAIARYAAIVKRLRIQLLRDNEDRSNSRSGSAFEPHPVVHDTRDVAPPQGPRGDGVGAVDEV